MAESIQISRKRMRYSYSSPRDLKAHIVTTSKSQILSDSSRRVVPNASRTQNRFRARHPTSLTRKIDPKYLRTYPRVTTKDLRLRRVFSPRSLSGDWGFNNVKGENTVKEQGGEYCDSRNLNVAKDGAADNVGGLGASGDGIETEEVLQTTPPDLELLSREPILAVNEAEPIRKEINGTAEKKNDTNLGSKSTLHQSSRAKIFKNPGSFSYKRLLPYLMQAADDGKVSEGCIKPEENFGHIHPITNMSCNKETGDAINVDAKVPREEVDDLIPETKPVSQSVDIVPNKLSAGSICGNTSPLKRVIASSPNKKPACSRRKLFRTPGSVNYRRMLPYLKDIPQDNPCALETNCHLDHHKNAEDNAQSLLQVSENEWTQETVASNVARESDTSSKTNNELSPCECAPVSLEQSDLDKEQETEVKHVLPDTENNLETPFCVLEHEAPLSPLVGSRSLSEVATSVLSQTFVDNLVGEENTNGAEKTEDKNSAEQLKADCSNLTVRLLDPVSGTPPSISPSKGILKTSIRGCRGICSCLNCSSFRLNAERAFEFSRNQLLDTEVMVLDLVGEISHLRDMLKKCHSADHNDSYSSQVGEASKRACEAAELAKSRLCQMNEDLQVHCRTPNEQRARVKFAHYVHEKTIS